MKEIKNKTIANLKNVSNCKFVNCKIEKASLFVGNIFEECEIHWEELKPVSIVDLVKQKILFWKKNKC